MKVLLFCGLLLLGWLIPDRFPPWQAFYNEAPAFLAVLVLAWWLRIWRTDIMSGHRLLWLVAALLGLIALQTATGLLPMAGDAYVAGAYLLGFALAWRIGIWLQESEAELQRWLTALAVTFALGATLSAWAAWVQWFGLEDRFAPWIALAPIVGRAGGNLGQPNQLATLMLMGIVALVLLWHGRRLSTPLTVVLVLWLSSGIAMTQSRTALLTAVCLAILVHLRPRSAERPRFKAWLPWAWFGVLLIITVLISTTGGGQGTSGAATSERMTAGGRPVMWHQLLAALAQSPWVGYGWLQTAAAQQRGALLVPGLEQTNYAHNLLLDLLLWCGVPLALVLFGLMAVWLFRRWRSVRREHDLLLFAWLLPMGVHSMLELPFAYAYFLFPVALLLGVLDSPGRSERGPLAGTVAHRVAGITSAMMLLTYTLLLPVLAWEYQHVEEDFRVARFENMKVGQTPPHYQMPSLHFLTQWGVVLQAMRVRAVPGMPDADIATLQAAAARFSWGALHFRYALALALNGRPEDAGREMQLIKGLFGPAMYAEARGNLEQMQQAQYPELARVPLPP